MEDKEFHCYECAGHAKAKGEVCLTCDGEGNRKTVVKIPEPKENPKKKVKK